MTEPHDCLIKKVFIEPIRTVILVDDEYPTLDSLAAKEVGEKGAWNGHADAVQLVRQVLLFARTRNTPWLVDVHDGKKVTSESERGIASHLDHSDLLVLDYHLDGNETNGDAAIKILRNLARSDYFNLVIVYTKGYAGELDKVIREIALGLTSPSSSLSFSEAEIYSINESLSQWDDHENGIAKKLEAEISENGYLEFRTKYPYEPQKFLSLDDGRRILEIFTTKPSTITITSKDLVKWLLLQKQEALKGQLFPENLGDVKVENQAGINWIRTDKLFITVLHKSCAPDQFEIKLLDAIKASFPSPHRLLLAKMRAEINHHGLTAEAAILGDRFIQAEWLNDFINSSKSNDSRAVIHNTISRHWEALASELSQTLGDFAEELRTFFSPLGINDVMQKCGLNAADIGTEESLKHFNSFSCTKPLDRSHLTTGHVLRINGTVNSEEQFWICLSPACDMVPSQKSHPSLKDCIPFVAVQLHKVSTKVALKKATENICVFLKIDGKIETFSISAEAKATINPHWEQKFARNQGRFSDEDKIQLGSIVEIPDKQLCANWIDASVVAQLRSEYALNLLQRVGSLLTRPGLGLNFRASLQA
jgi:hypothetical protein